MGFNPGPVSAKAQVGQILRGTGSHADFESRCELCHQPLATAQADLCIRCHTSVADQIASGTGMHAWMTSSSRCFECHPEHRGRDFDPTQFALDRIDHSTTGFPLIGKHAEANCGDCHDGSPTGAAPRVCLDCHSEPEVHRGLFISDCSSCHAPTAWKPAQIAGVDFDHSRLAFTLVRHLTDKTGQPILCTGCHTPGDTPSAGQDIPTGGDACAGCHRGIDAAFTAQHLDRYGSDCVQCHDGSDSMRGFSHDQVFPLTGKHAALECQACHADRTFKDTPASCAGCHDEPAVHAGFFGLRCGSCHTTAVWRPARLQVHSFPLNHGQEADVDCRTCHPSTYPEYTCTSCHEHPADEITRKHAEEGISSADLPDCVRCHPGGQKERD